MNDIKVGDRVKITGTPKMLDDMIHYIGKIVTVIEIHHKEACSYFVADASVPFFSWPLICAEKIYSHIHADSMAEYAKDALVTDKPWELWECLSDTSDCWESAITNLRWQSTHKFRRKQISNINGFKVPKPIHTAPKDGTLYYTPDLAAIDGFRELIWYNDTTDKRILSLNICHLTKEAAKIHSSALISLTK
jgi:hypothetical protein